jgi:hypothetical protein
MQFAAEMVAGVRGAESPSSECVGGGLSVFSVLGAYLKPSELQNRLCV